MANDEGDAEPRLIVDLTGPKAEAVGERSWVSALDPAPGEARASWAVDGSGVVTVASDPLGFHPLYYASAPTRFAVSPSLIALARSGVPTTFDEDALAVGARLGFFLGEDTPFAAIRAMAVAGRLTWGSGTLQVSAELPEVAASPATRASEVFADLFHEAVGRRLPSSGYYALPLSGGRDSRHILLEPIPFN